MVQFRSETMSHGTLVLPSDRARELVDVLGRRSNIQIVDMNAHTMSRPYKKYIQRIDELERILRFLMEEIDKLPDASITKNKIDNFLDNDHVYELDRVEESLQKLYEQFVKFRDNNADLVQQKNSAIEEKAVATAALKSMGIKGSPPFSRDRLGTDTQNLLDVETADGGKPAGLLGPDRVGFTNIAGIISQNEQEKFARTIFRATRGNAFTLFETIEDEVEDMKTGKKVSVLKNVFVVYYQGGPNSAAHERIMKICSAFGVPIYSWPSSDAKADERISRLQDVIADKSSALEAYENYFVGEISILLALTRPGGNSLIEEWRLFCLKEKALYATLNLFEGSDVTLRADCWFPACDEEKIRQILMTQSNVQQVSAFLLTDSRPLLTHNQPPTYFRCTEFTLGFQDFVDTYGIPRYKEANPALLTIITLPFLFGIMYGDIGHGAFVLFTGIYMVTMWHRQLKYLDNELLKMVGGGRYMILLMGIFAVYAGFLYNDFFALGVDIFGTRFIPDPNRPPSKDEQFTIQDPSRSIYPFGFDPAWKGATNEIDFFNSFKMKFSVIVAFLQMGVGVGHKALNALYFKDHLTLWFEFLPQMIFLSLLVGYMDILIIYKWVTPISEPKPNIITIIIDMFFFKAEDPFWSFQKTLQEALVVCMVICIPWMLLPKPIIRKVRMDKLKKKRQAVDDSSRSHELSKSSSSVVRKGTKNEATEAIIDMPDGHEEEEEEYNFAEEFIHQMIETIEFVLGAISNTASYLRLWALSLAHQQLALVFFENIVLMVLDNDMSLGLRTIGTWAAFAVFAYVTFAVMLCMDSLECFLHALRLQWVEFQNKFYHADGHKFIPFSFTKALVHSED